MYPSNRLDSFSDEDMAVADSDRDDAEATERVCAALITLRERSRLDDDKWAQRLGLDVKTLHSLERGQVLDQPSASLLLRAVQAFGAELKINFGHGEKPIKI